METKIGYLIIALLIAFTPALAQKHGLTFSFQPNMLFNPGTYTHHNPNLPALIESRRVAGASLQIAYKRYLNKKIFASAGVRILKLRHGYNNNLLESGFNDNSLIKYEKYWAYSDIPFYSGVGLTLQAGYMLPVSNRSIFAIIPGIHVDHTKAPVTEYSELLNRGDINNIGIEKYEEIFGVQFTTTKSNYWGADLSILYHLKTKKARVGYFAGAMASIDVGKPVTANYISYNFMPVRNGGTISINRNYFGLVFGLEIYL